MGYGTVALKSKSKGYLFKLLEFNKIAIQEGHQFMKSNSILEKLVTQFMFCEGNGSDFNGDLSAPKAQSVTEDKAVSLSNLNTVSNLKTELENVLKLIEEPSIKIEGTQAECQSVILSIIMYVDTKAKELYRQCHKYGLIEQTKIAMYARQMNQNFN